MPRFILPALLLSSLWMGQGVHAQVENPFDQAAKAREQARQRAEDARERNRVGGQPPKVGEPEQVFDKGAAIQQAARQRAFDRGQKTALPAQEERESLGRLPEPSNNAIRAEDGSAVKQGAPAAATYNRVMETRRHFTHYGDIHLRNVNDSYTDKPEDRKRYDAEAERIYPELHRQQSAFALRHQAIGKWIDSRQPPLATDARRRLLLAHMVSLELFGQLRLDCLGIGQIPQIHYMGQRPPAFIKRNNFEVEVKGDVALLPDGLRGKVIRGQEDKPDIIQWLDAEGIHILQVPQEASGKVRLFKDYDCDYRRLELQGANFRIIFTKPH